jgi:hypothetical protein
MSAIEAVAEAIHRAFDHTPSDDVFGDCARAAVAALAAQGDITDEQIVEATTYTHASAFQHAASVEAVRALLARQAAVHAADYDPEHPCPDSGQFTATCRYYARAEAAEARVAELEAWAEDAIRDRERAVAAEAEVKRLERWINESGVMESQAEVTALRATVDRVRALLPKPGTYIGSPGVVMAHDLEIALADPKAAVSDDVAQAWAELADYADEALRRKADPKGDA